MKQLLSILGNIFLVLALLGHGFSMAFAGEDTSPPPLSSIQQAHSMEMPQEHDVGHSIHECCTDSSYFDSCTQIYIHRGEQDQESLNQDDLTPALPPMLHDRCSLSYSPRSLTQSDPPPHANTAIHIRQISLYTPLIGAVKSLT